MSELTKEKLVTVHIDTPIQIGDTKYGVGSHEVPEELSVDLIRINSGYLKYESTLNKNDQSSGNLGSVSAA